MNIGSHQAKATDTGMSMVKNNSMRIEPGWSMVIRAWFLWFWFPGCGMVGCLSMTGE